MADTANFQRDGAPRDPPGDPDDAFYLRVTRAITPPAIAGGILVNLFYLYAAFGRWPLFAKVALAGVSSFVLNLLVIDVWIRRRQRLTVGQREALRLALNLAYALIQGHWLHWATPTWAFLLVLTIPVDGLKDRTATRRLGIGVLFFNVAAVADGGAVADALLFSGMGLVGFFVAAARMAVIREIYVEAEDQHQALLRAHHDLKHMHDRAVASEKLVGLGMMAAGIAHEINNPMAFVTANLECLERDLTNLPRDRQLLDEYSREVLPQTINGIQRVNAIVADLRRFARGESSEKSVSFDLNAEVESALRIANGPLKHRCRVTAELAKMPLLQGHPQQIAQVVVNLLVNAAQAIPEDRVGKVRVSTERVGAFALVRISDNGKGMSEALRKRIFEPFFTTKAVGEGTGLGLSIVRDIVTAHGGEIEVASEEGCGTTFTLRLPIPGAPIEASEQGHLQTRGELDSPQPEAVQ